MSSFFANNPNSGEDISQSSIPDGHGVYTCPNGHRYEGNFKDGKYNGHGVMRFTLDGEKYDGEWNNGKMHGHGVYTWPNGQKYDGQWKDGKKHGHGVLTVPGQTYDGEWRHGQWRYGLECDHEERYKKLLAEHKQLKKKCVVFRQRLIEKNQQLHNASRLLVIKEQTIDDLRRQLPSISNKKRKRQ